MNSGQRISENDIDMKQLSAKGAKKYLLNSTGKVEVLEYIYFNNYTNS